MTEFRLPAGEGTQLERVGLVAECRAMDFVFTPEQLMLRDAARDFLESKAPLGTTRGSVEEGAGFDEPLWKEMAQLGWQGMGIPEAYGGSGFSFRELAIVIEETGRCLLPAPFLSSVVLAASALLRSGSEEQKQLYLPAIAGGDMVAAVAWMESQDWHPEDPQTTATETGGAIVLEGVKSYVIEGTLADTFLVSARSPTSDVALYLVERDAPGLAVRPLPTLDLTRPLAEITLDGVAVSPDRRLGTPGSGVEALRHVIMLGAVALAYESVGGAEVCLDMAVDYAKDRIQFGRPIGSFQAVKHRCADMLVQVDVARSAAQHAGWAAAWDASELPVAAAVAKSACSDAYFFVAAETIQIHGGIGFTWEHDAHLYFKRAKANRLLFGDPAQWRSRLADLIDG